MTPFGLKLRKMRAERDIALKDMAKALNISSAYLSSLEHGHRGTPTWFMLQRIITYFNVIWDEAEELQRLAEISDPKIAINTAGMDASATELANILAQNIHRLSDEQMDELSRDIRAKATRN